MQTIEVELRKSLNCSLENAKRLKASKFILLEIITSKAYIEFLTTYLNDNHKFRSIHNKAGGLESKM